MSRIKAISNLHREQARGATSEINVRSTSFDVRVFLRRMPQGLVVVSCYLPRDSGSRAETLVEMTSYGDHWSRWYAHGVTTTRKASLLINRFLADWEEVQAP